MGVAFDTDPKPVPRQPPRPRLAISLLALWLLPFEIVALVALVRIAPWLEERQWRSTWLVHLDVDLTALPLLERRALAEDAEMRWGAELRKLEGSQALEGYRLSAITRAGSDASIVVLFSQPSSASRASSLATILVDERGHALFVSASRELEVFRVKARSKSLGQARVTRIEKYSSWDDDHDPLSVQYVSRSGDRLVTVRNELRRGRLFPGYDLELSPPLPERSVDEWVTVLEGPDWAGRLGALVWLSGVARCYTQSLNAEQKAVHADPRARTAVAKLARSADAWTAEAAGFVLSLMSDGAAVSPTTTARPTGVFRSRPQDEQHGRRQSLSQTEPSGGYSPRTRRQAPPQSRSSSSIPSVASAAPVRVAIAPSLSSSSTR